KSRIRSPNSSDRPLCRRLRRHFCVGYVSRFVAGLWGPVLSILSGRSGLAENAVHARSHGPLFCFLAPILNRSRPRLSAVTYDRIESPCSPLHSLRAICLDPIRLAQPNQTAISCRDPRG